MYSAVGFCPSAAFYSSSSFISLSFTSYAESITRLEFGVTTDATVASQTCHLNSRKGSNVSVMSINALYSAYPFFALALRRKVKTDMGTHCSFCADVYTVLSWWKQLTHFMNRLYVLTNASTSTIVAWSAPSLCHLCTLNRQNTEPYQGRI